MTIDILALARETYLGTEDSEQHWIAFGNAIIERCAAELERLALFDSEFEPTSYDQVVLSDSAKHIRSMKAPTP